MQRNSIDLTSKPELTLSVHVRRGLVRRFSWMSVVGCGLWLVGCPGPESSDDDDASEDLTSSSYEQDGGILTEEGKDYSASEADESAVHVFGGGTYSLSGSSSDEAQLNKTGDTSKVDDSNFYGKNAIVLAEEASTINLSYVSLTSSAEGANGAFAYEEGSVVNLDHCTIETHGNSSRGVDATYGGTINITHSSISTDGAHCAALASDRYENFDPPAINATGVTGTTAGEGSPGIYCTGTFTIAESTLTATGSEAAAIEGLNSITLSDSDITGTLKWGVIIYQSMSGDSSVGTGTFSMSGGTLTNNSSGPDFMVCNTSAEINLEGVTIGSDTSDVLLRATDASSGDANINSDWGTAGGEVVFTASDQTLEGAISCNSRSTIELSLTGTSTLVGPVLTELGGEVSLTLAGSATWTATADSTVHTLSGVGLDGSTPTNVDAAAGITIEYGSGAGLSGSYTLESGGTLVEVSL